MMNRNDFLNAIIDDGITEVNITYLDPKHRHKRDGAISGFEACRGKTDEELLTLYEEAVHQDGINKYLNNVVVGRYDPNNLKQYISLQDYWYHRYYTLQIEWVLNVLSAALHNQGLTPLINPTARGLIKAANILGVKA